ncbi:MAG: CoA pyrophosphatase [Polynucleobacter sp. 24-46-87]|jgi:8-oxo-dGTP pyrophosphatase MutT (NUDIX family)|uniref:CoA pyrophosphatase n=1 Tax=Polynucleobacter sp. 39-46-10 TaxID=1970428 RepID=UPI000BD296AE|nr:CoA pyrophosphatase [Polynucleobacter sp. 39-46-10]OZA15626.1 MAG: CoA pyrophosphatase [Polynucleobacter sp. 24-46-87]OZA77645.1 MAG: CoA pyrophosphatase [Polynucleobacter sp. 39-46-10]
MTQNQKPQEQRLSAATPLSFDAQAIPIHEVCASQSKVASHHLNPLSLKSRFQSPPAWQPEITDENRQVIAAGIIRQRQAAGKVTRAAVLIPLLQKSEGLSVLLTQRTDHLHDHAGQISFPGGRMDPGDSSPNDTALRESEEEIGLDRRGVEIIGHLPQYLTVSGYSVTPVVGLVQPQAEYALDAFEVADIFEVPLHFLMDPANHQVRVWESDQGSRRFYSMPYENRFIWGATAGMLRNLYHLLKV